VIQLLERRRGETRLTASISPKLLAFEIEEMTNWSLRRPHKAAGQVRIFLPRYGRNRLEFEDGRTVSARSRSLCVVDGPPAFRSLNQEPGHPYWPQAVKKNEIKCVPEVRSDWPMVSPSMRLENEARSGVMFGVEPWRRARASRSSESPSCGKIVQMVGNNVSRFDANAMRGLRVKGCLR
jgi:hypothetical protein